LNAEYPMKLLDKWDSTGYLAQISRRLGYRLALTAATAPVSVSAGGSMTVSFGMKNAGFGKVYNARPIDLVFVGSGGPFTARLTADARRDLPLAGQTTTLSYTVNAPAGLVSGQPYALHLRLPDPASGLASDNKYVIRLANSSVWDASTGRNALGLSVVA